MCTCLEMERLVCTAVMASRRGFEVMEGATMTIAIHLHGVVEKVPWENSYGRRKHGKNSLVENGCKNQLAEHASPRWVKMVREWQS